LSAALFFRQGKIKRHSSEGNFATSKIASGAHASLIFPTRKNKAALKQNSQQSASQQC